MLTFNESITTLGGEKWQIFETWFTSKNYKTDLFSSFRGTDEEAFEGIKVALYSIPFTSLEFEFQVGVFQKFFQETNEILYRSFCKEVPSEDNLKNFVLDYFLSE